MVKNARLLETAPNAISTWSTQVFRVSMYAPRHIECMCHKRIIFRDRLWYWTCRSKVIMADCWFCRAFCARTNFCEIARNSTHPDVYVDLHNIHRPGMFSTWTNLEDVPQHLLMRVRPHYRNWQINPLDKWPLFGPLWQMTPFCLHCLTPSDAQMRTTVLRYLWNIVIAIYLINNWY